MNTIEQIEFKIKKLSPELQIELNQILGALLERNLIKNNELTMNFDWLGALEEADEDSVSLQKKSLKWR